MRIRRAPKIPVFLILGGGLGAIVTFILTASFPVDPAVGFGPTFGYFCLYGIPAGIVLGAIVALLVDRSSAKHARTVTVEHETVERVEPVVEAEIVEPEAQPEYEARVVTDDTPTKD